MNIKFLCYLLLVLNNKKKKYYLLSAGLLVFKFHKQCNAQKQHSGLGAELFFSAYIWGQHQISSESVG
jgi:hypothetical protein